ncbi:MAG: hypothetical protein INQ03_20415 [Candidatus Heimdallarchaeota archaeon]|nr:hypothetical protein [Candidatus Heimdallarchaeota archaeon]
MSEQNKETVFEAGRGTKIADSVADIHVEVYKIAREVLNTPLRVGGRVVDGFNSGMKRKGIKNVFQGTFEGVIDGVQTSAHNIGRGFLGMGQGFSELSRGLMKEERGTELIKED